MADSKCEGPGPSYLVDDDELEEAKSAQISAVEKVRSQEDPMLQLLNELKNLSGIVKKGLKIGDEPEIIRLSGLLELPAKGNKETVSPVVVDFDEFWAWIFCIPKNSRQQELKIQLSQGRDNLNAVKPTLTYSLKDLTSASGQKLANSKADVKRKWPSERKERFDAPWPNFYSYTQGTKEVVQVARWPYGHLTSADREALRVVQQKECSSIYEMDLEWSTYDRSIGVLPFDYISPLLSLLGHPDKTKLSRPVQHPTYDFLWRHASPWPANEPRFLSFYDGEEYIYLQFHLRSFVTDVSPEEETQGLSGIKCERDDGLLSFLGHDPFPLTERRCSFALRTMVRTGRLGVHQSDSFALVVISDPLRSRSLDEIPPTKNFHEEEVQNIGMFDMKRVKSLDRFGLLQAGLLIGITVLQHEICKSIIDWESDWTATLTRIDGVGVLSLQ